VCVCALARVCVCSYVCVVCVCACARVCAACPFWAMRFVLSDVTASCCSPIRAGTGKTISIICSALKVCMHATPWLHTESYLLNHAQSTVPWQSILVCLLCDSSCCNGKTIHFKLGVCPQPTCVIVQDRMRETHETKGTGPYLSTCTILSDYAKHPPSCGHAHTKALIKRCGPSPLRANMQARVLYYGFRKQMARHNRRRTCMRSAQWLEDERAAAAVALANAAAAAQATHFDDDDPDWLKGAAVPSSTGPGAGWQSTSGQRGAGAQQQGHGQGSSRRELAAERQHLRRSRAPTGAVGLLRWVCGCLGVQGRVRVVSCRGVCMASCESLCRDRPRGLTLASLPCNTFILKGANAV